MSNRQVMETIYVIFNFLKFNLSSPKNIVERRSKFPSTKLRYLRKLLFEMSNHRKTKF